MKASRSKRALINTIAGFSEEIVILICGLILPRLILTAFGSSYNGITSSITQFISCISLMKAGIGGVARAALYKPFANGNSEEISAIVSQTEKYMRRIAVIFIVFIFVFALFYPLLVKDEFSWFFSSALIVIISASTFAQYFFGLPYQIVLQADQKQNVLSAINIVSTILNTIISVILIELGFGIHVVKLGSACVFVLSPIFIRLYTKKKYQITSNFKGEKDLISQRWDALGHEVANFINNNTDIMVLTIFSSLGNVSVYTVYNMVIANIRNIVNNFVVSFGSAFGDMYTRNEIELMRSNLKLFELIVFSTSSVIYSTTIAMITPFAMIYTHGVVDANYYQPIFAVIFGLSGAFSCFRIPYETVIKALGHYKQTRNGSFIEAILNISISVVCVTQFGLIGVAVGTLVATVFRTMQFALYLGRNVIKRSIGICLAHIFISLCTIAITYLIAIYIPYETTNFLQWAIKAFSVTVIATCVTLIFNVVFYKQELKELLRKMFGILKLK